MGMSLGVVGLLIAIVYGGLVGPIVKWLGEDRTVRHGLLVMATGFIGYSLSTQGWMMLGFIVPFALGCVAMPALRGMMANRVAPDEQGSLLGLEHSLFSMARIGGPKLGTLLLATGSGGLWPVETACGIGDVLLVLSLWATAAQTAAKPKET